MNVTQYTYVQQIIERRARYEVCAHCGQEIYPQKTSTGTKEVWRHLSTRVARCSGINGRQAQCARCSHGKAGQSTVAQPAQRNN